MTAVIEFVDTPDGPFGLIADADGRVIASGWTADPEALLARLAPAHRQIGTTPGETRAGEAVTAYYGGDVRAIDTVEVAQTGGDFHRAGWAALRTIEPGHPLSYQQFAAHLGRPTAVRAAASACARNAVALFVPCHRVLRTDGSLGGFAWGTPVKRSLLAREATAEPGAA
ncbi:methylated-DNA--[protein]-cysteine S-methyltransferase [Herbiconiux sp. CPCC 205716]|uniref:Methylated-DNA--[protein]-cysteine S-methyltransferase n=1 Tax=Herbiconiux gentiana TaxID=2970912 RepID=A0ABT2GB56_9MICO|nr:methylated-DNA--[protein]-cysteine S-methyltransferase [Herbiconiux gentiana]MCS5713433.1 methylated-DNA--[protein]-cysteine S-methyltransferase [Herbiconiux gentiana]